MTIAPTHGDLLEPLHPAIEHQEDILNIGVLSTLQDPRHQAAPYRKGTYPVYYGNCFFSASPWELFQEPISSDLGGSPFG